MQIDSIQSKFALYDLQNSQSKDFYLSPEKYSEIKEIEKKINTYQNNLNYEIKICNPE